MLIPRPSIRHICFNLRSSLKQVLVTLLMCCFVGSSWSNKYIKITCHANVFDDVMMTSRSTCGDLKL